MLTLLISTYENAVIKNKELNIANNELSLVQNRLYELNKSLEHKVVLRTQELEEKIRFFYWKWRKTTGF